MKKKRQDKILFIAFVVGLFLSFFSVSNRNIVDLFWLVLLIYLSHWAIIK